MLHFNSRVISFICDALTVALGLMWVYAGSMKLTDLWGLMDSLLQYKLLPVSWVTMAASTLPWMELLIGAGLIMGVLPYLKRVSENRIFLLTMSWMSMALLTVFFVAMYSVMWRGLEVTCGCFGADAQLVGWVTIGRDFGLILLNSVLLWRLKV